MKNRNKSDPKFQEPMFVDYLPLMPGWLVLALILLGGWVGVALILALIIGLSCLDMIKINRLLFTKRKEEDKKDDED